MTLADLVLNANTGADAIKKAPIVNEDTELRCLRIGDVSQKRDYEEWGFTKTTEADYERYKLEIDDLIIARTGNTIGVNCIIEDNLNSVYNNGLIRIKADTSKVIPRYLWYMISSKNCQDFVQSIAYGTSTQPNMKINDFLRYSFEYQDLDIQKRIVEIIDPIDKKIKANTAINRNLSEQALAIYHKMFIETDNDERTTCRTDEFFDITIGKTPPRKEKEWFSDNPEDCVWISISDMGSCGTFITDSSEYLTKAAVDKHNVKVVPDNTVILSFKLTVGRIAITVGETTTNEAIAHFNTSKDNITEYLYCYLKSFDFGSLGSTSSIGTAVNSKTIKAMDFVIPEESELQEFCDIARPMFEQIKKNQFENQNLISMRDSLLPKLMSGELDVSDLDI